MANTPSPPQDRFKYIRAGIIIGMMIAGFLADQALGVAWKLHPAPLLKATCAVAPYTPPAALVLPSTVFEAGRDACAPAATFHTVAAQVLMLKVDVSYLVWIFELYVVFEAIILKDDTFLDILAGDLLKREINSFREDISYMFRKCAFGIVACALLTYIPLKFGIYETFSLENPLTFANFMTNFALGVTDFVAVTSMNTLFLAKVWFDGHNV